jgi:hypothetical protein
MNHDGVCVFVHLMVMIIKNTLITRMSFNLICNLEIENELEKKWEEKKKNPRCNVKINI